jgi:hypothetical protein
MRRLWQWLRKGKPGQSFWKRYIHQGVLISISSERVLAISF